MAGLDDQGVKPVLSGTRVTVAESTDASGHPLLTVVGEVDISSVEALRPAVEAATRRSPAGIVFEVSGLTFMDSSGIALLLTAAEQVTTVELRNPSAMIRRIVEISGLASTLRMTP